MTNLAIRGHKTRGKEVIEILEMLGGRNASMCTGANINTAYVLASYGSINIIDYVNLNNQEYNLCLFTLEEFLEKFPYKVGAKVLVKPYVGARQICEMKWDSDDNCIKYGIGVGEWFKVLQLQPYKKETMDEVNKAVFDANAQCCDIMNHLIKEETMEKTIKIDIPKGYEFAGVDNQQVVFEKVELKYPKTYRECAEIVGFNIEEEPTIFGYKEELLDRFQKLLICRDAYWKLAGDWKPDWDNNRTKYIITVAENKIYTDVTYIFNYVLCFPTEEMRDAFYENFEDLIIDCMELL